MGQILAVSGAESKLQYLHAREPALRQQLIYAGKQLAQVLGHDGHIPQRLLHGAKQLHARAAAPLARLGGLRAVGAGIIGVEAAEMVDAQNIVKIQGIADAPHPPGKAGFFVVGPVVQRVAPKLACVRKCVRRAAGNLFWGAAGIQQKQLRRGPYVRAVRRHIDGDIPHDLDTVFPCIGLEGGPLEAELVLAEFPEMNFRLMLGIQLPDGLRRVGTHGLGPLQIAFPFIQALGCHIQRIILQLVAEAVVVVRVPSGKTGESLAQNTGPAVVQSRVIHCALVGAAFLCPVLAFFQKTFFAQDIEIDKIGVAGKGRTALIGAVPKARR